MAILAAKVGVNDKLNGFAMDRGQHCFLPIIYLRSNLLHLGLSLIAGKKDY